MFNEIHHSNKYNVNKGLQYLRKYIKIAICASQNTHKVIVKNKWKQGNREENQALY